MYRCESWTIKKTEHRRIHAFELWCWRILLRVLWTARRSNQSMLKEISPEYSSEGLMLKLKLLYFGHLMCRADLLEKTRAESSTASILWHSAFFIVQLSHLYMTTGKTIALIRWTFVSKLGASLVTQTVKCLSAMQETRVWSLGWEDPLEKEMAAHSSILAWKIPWTMEPGRLPSMGSQRVGHDWATSLSLCQQTNVSVF